MFGVHLCVYQDVLLKTPRSVLRQVRPLLRAPAAPAGVPAWAPGRVADVHAPAEAPAGVHWQDRVADVHAGARPSACLLFRLVTLSCFIVPRAVSR